MKERIHGFVRLVFSLYIYLINLYGEAFKACKSSSVISTRVLSSELVLICSIFFRILLIIYFLIEFIFHEIIIESSSNIHLIDLCRNPRKSPRKKITKLLLEQFLEKSLNRLNFETISGELSGVICVKCLGKFLVELLKSLLKVHERITG